jgi:SPP1 gp7 family putative phage head morphogenesis protein
MWEAKRIQRKLAALNAIKIRAALKVTVNTKKVAADFLSTGIQTTNNPTSDRVLARSWAMLNVKFEGKPLQMAIERTIAEGWVTGQKAAGSEIKRAALNLTKGSVAEIVTDPAIDVWRGWKPGDAATAALLDRPYGLQILLETSGITIRSVERTMLDEIGTRLAEGKKAGLSIQDMADSIDYVVNNPAKALSIATTEVSRAVNTSAQTRYREARIGTNQWMGIDPCDKCAQNDGEIVEIGQPFASGDSQPPAHPNCLCTLLPVIAPEDFIDRTEEATAAVDSVYDDSLARELLITPQIMAIAEKTRGVVDGLKFRVKQPNSLRRKIVDQVRLGEYATPAEAAANISDTVRYTVAYDRNEYLTGVTNALDELRTKGYQLKVKNYWERADYKGINVAVKDADGKLFELQLHTKESLAIKEDLHALYEQYRVSRNDAERWRLWNRMTEIAAKTPEPANFQGLLKVGELRYEYFTDAKGVRRTAGEGIFKPVSKPGVKLKPIKEPEPMKPMPTMDIKPSRPIDPLQPMLSVERKIQLDNDIAEFRANYFVNEDELRKDLKNPDETRLGATAKEFYRKRHANLKYQERNLAAEADVQRLYYYLKNKYMADNDLKEAFEVLSQARIKEFKAAEIASKEKALHAFKEGNVTIAIKPSDFRKVLEEGKFKNQFETQTSNGLFDPKLRQVSEAAQQQIPIQSEAAQRPVYGYITTKKELQNTVPDESVTDAIKRIWDNKLSINSANVDQYGDFRIVLKSDVKNRTTVTIGDSLYQGQLAEHITNPNPDLIQAGFYGRGVSPHGVFPSFNYMEAQITGGVTLNDIAAIYVPDGTDIVSLVNKLKELGLNIQVEYR